MRITLGLAALALTASASAALAQPREPGAPRGSYERQCSNIQMNGQFLSAVCRGAHGGGQSSINVASCSGDIGVDATGALSCAGPGAAAPAPPNVYAAPRAGYGQRDRGDDARAYDNRGYDNRGYDNRGYDNRGYDNRGYGREAASLFAGRDFRGAAVRIDGPTPNLARLGLNDRVRSIELDRRAGPWLVCSDADYRGRCVTVDRSVSDTRQIGLRDAISSMRPLR